MLGWNFSSPTASASFTPSASFGQSSPNPRGNRPPTSVEIGEEIPSVPVPALTDPDCSPAGLELGSAALKELDADDRGAGVKPDGELCAGGGVGEDSGGWIDCLGPILPKNS